MQTNRSGSPESLLKFKCVVIVAPVSNVKSLVKLGRNETFFCHQQAKEMVMELIREQGFREQRGEYGSRVGGESLDVSATRLFFCFLFNVRTLRF